MQQATVDVLSTSDEPPQQAEVSVEVSASQQSHLDRPHCPECPVFDLTGGRRCMVAQILERNEQHKRITPGILKSHSTPDIASLSVRTESASCVVPANRELIARKLLREVNDRAKNPNITAANKDLLTQASASLSHSLQAALQSSSARRHPEPESLLQRWWKLLRMPRRP